ncbi:MAG: nuclear transport factor 2 family protein [Acidobacteriota bacterium]
MKLAPLCILAALSAFPQTQDAEKQAVIHTVERTFQAMAARDAAALRATLFPGAQFHAVRPDGSVSAAASEEFIARIAAAKEPPLERMWNPAVLISGRLAALWAEYDFHRGAQFSHCGVDAAHLIKTAEGWKITSIAYTVQKDNCPLSPLGPPAAVIPLK